MRTLLTGMGVVSAAGIGIEDSLRSMYSGERNLGGTHLLSTPLEYPVFEVADLPEEYAVPGQRTLGLALLAVEQALDAAGIDRSVTRTRRIGVCLGTTVATQLNDIEFYRTLKAKGSAPMEPVDRYLKGEISATIAGRFRLTGPSLSVVNACSSGTDAIGVGLAWLRSGICDIVVAGGADEMNIVPFCGFASLQVASMEACAPFDSERAGLNLGEGAGVVVMESDVSARDRGAGSGLSVVGYGSCSDAYHLTAPSPDGRGLRDAIGRALSEAGARTEDFAFINAHGTATRDNDKVEGSVFKDIFGPSVKFLSTKGYTGHTLGAAGGIEAVFTAAGLLEAKVPSSAGFSRMDEEIGIAPVTETTAVSGRMALSTSLAFGGNNSAVVIALD